MRVIIHHRCSGCYYGYRGHTVNVVGTTDGQMAVRSVVWRVRRRRSGRLVGRLVGGGTRLIDDDRPGAAPGQRCVPLIRVDDRVR